MADTQQEALTAALRAVLRDFDREPPASYMPEAVRIFNEALAAIVPEDTAAECPSCGHVMLEHPQCCPDDMHLTPDGKRLTWFDIVPEDAVAVTRENAWILDRVVAPDLTLAEIREAGSISAARFARLRAAQEETP